MVAAEGGRQGRGIIWAGIPSVNMGLYRRLRFSVPDVVVLIDVTDGVGGGRSTLILRDIEMGRARAAGCADVVGCPADFAPSGGLSGDRETATAQAAAECLRRAGIGCVTADRSLPLIFSAVLGEAGIEVVCDLEMGVLDRRCKDEEEIGHLREAQRVTEGAVRLACETIARAVAGADGVLVHDGAVLTSERVRFLVDVWLLEQDFANVPCIVAGGAQGADCHEHGSGALRTGEPVIVDIFPQSRASFYNGDCTRTVLHGEVPDAVAGMHAAVQAAKVAGTGAIGAGVSGEAVHRATIGAIVAHGYGTGLWEADAPAGYCAMTHGTGHGVGLEVHEPPLLDFKGPTLVVGDVLTVEPGVYAKGLGGVRLEDMVVVTEDGCENFNVLPEGLDWG